MIQLDKLLKGTEVAEWLDCSVQHVNRLRRSGAFPGIAVGGMWRYDPADIRKYLNAQKGAAA